MNWLKARLNEPSTHASIATLLTLGLIFAPSADQPYIAGVSMLLGALGFALPERAQKAVGELQDGKIGPQK